MNKTAPASRTSSLIIMLAGALMAACVDDQPIAPVEEPAIVAQMSNQTSDENEAFATLRRVTARYHRLDVAMAEGFVFLHGCEDRPDEGPVGAVYVHFERLIDGKIDPALPDALIYEPGKDNQAPKLIGVELAIPYALWTESTPPTFLGATFQPEDEFGVFGLHVWVWKQNPEGMFAESHPNVTCAAE